MGISGAGSYQVEREGLRFLVPVAHENELRVCKYLPTMHLLGSHIMVGDLGYGMRPMRYTLTSRNPLKRSSTGK